MYQYRRKVTYSETGADKCINAAQLIKYFQDCSTFQSEHIGVGLEHLNGVNHQWVLVSWQIVIDEYPELLDEVVTGTWAYDFNSMYGFRNFVLDYADGRRAACANSIWVLINSETGRPVKITEDEISAYDIEEKLPMSYESRHIKAKGCGAEKRPLSIRKSDLDTNHHVNNARYVEIALEYVPEHFNIKQVRVEYKKSALLGDIIVPNVEADRDHVLVILESIDKRVFAVVEFRK